MKSKFFSLVDYDALNLWLNIVASGQQKWTLDEATEFFGEELKVHLPRLLSSNFLSGNYSEFWIPSFPEFSQLVLEETFMNIANTSKLDQGEVVGIGNIETKIRQRLEQYEKYRVENYSKMRSSFEQTIKDSVEELEEIFRNQFKALQGEDGKIVPQLNPIDVLEQLQTLKTNMRNTLNELQEQSKLQIADLIEKANNVFERTLSGDAFGISEDHNFTSSMMESFTETMEKYFNSFNQRNIASTELFKLDVGKLSKAQIELINSLESIIAGIVERSVTNLGENTSKILDYIFINLRQNLDSLAGNIAGRVQDSENQSKEGIANLVSSVFTINRKVVEELIEALNILSQSASKMKKGLNNNLAKIEQSIREQVESSVEQLEASVDDIRQIQDTTYNKIIKASEQNDISNLKLFEETLKMVEKALNEIQESLDEKFIQAKNSFLSSSRLAEIVSESKAHFEEATASTLAPVDTTVSTFLEHLDNNYVIIPKSKVASITPDASSYVNANISSAVEAAEEFGLKDALTRTMDEQRTSLLSIHDNTISQITDHHKILLNKTSEFIETLGLYLKTGLTAILKQITDSMKSRIDEIRGNSEKLREELKQDLEMGFSFIYDSIDPINMRLMHFKEVETPEFFEISKEKVVGIADVISNLIQKIYTQAEKNRDKLNDQIQITEMILNNQIEALKVNVMSQISNIITKNKNELLSSIELHRSQVSKDIENVRSLIQDIVQEELDLPVREFGIQLSKIEESVITMQQVSTKEIDTLRNEIHALLRRLQMRINGINKEVATVLKSVSSRGLDDLSTLRISAQSELQVNFTEVDSSLQLQVSQLGSYLSTHLKDQIEKIQKLNSLSEGGLSHSIRTMLNQVQKRLEDLYTDTSAFLNELRERNSISMLYGDISKLLDSMNVTIQGIDLDDVKMLIEALSQITGRPSLVI